MFMEEKQPLSLEERHDIILDIMKDIDSFCRSHDIKYTISAGTMLGAVRHGGFIPWDDDADLFMLREDFDRFAHIYKSDKYHLLYNTRKSDEFLATGFIKISDPDTVVKNNSTRTSYGVYVDIFPLDAVPAEPKSRHKYMHKLISLHNRLYHRQQKDIISYLKAYRHSLDWWWNKLDSEVHSGIYDDSGWVAQVIGTDNYRTVLKREVFDDLKDIEFESHKFLGFSDPHSYLSMLYGPDYMTPVKWAHNETIYRR